jgi:CBS domain-containing protein
MSAHPGSPVSTIMSWPVATIDHDATLEEAAESLAADNIGVLLVLSQGALIGLISERDIVAHVANRADLSHLLVGEVMSGDLVTIAPEKTISAAARTMNESDVRHLPVMVDTRIAGVVSVRDLVPVLAADEAADVVVLPAGTRVILRTP